MSDAPGQDPGPAGKRALTLDLSTGAGPTRPKRPKGFVPVVQQTINLTRKRAAPPAEPSAEARPAPPGPAPQRPGPKGPDGRGPSARRDEGPGGGQPSGGTSLADLLDEATLARLRGGA